MVIPYSSRQFSGIHSNAVNGSAISVDYLRNNSQNGKPISEYISVYTQGRLACDIMYKKKAENRKELTHLKLFTSKLNNTV